MGGLAMPERRNYYTCIFMTTVKNKSLHKQPEPFLQKPALPLNRYHLSMYLLAFLQIGGAFFGIFIMQRQRMLKQVKKLRFKTR